MQVLRTRDDDVDFISFHFCVNHREWLWIVDSETCNELVTQVNRRRRLISNFSLCPPQTEIRLFKIHWKTSSPSRLLLFEKSFFITNSFYFIFLFSSLFHRFRGRKLFHVFHRQRSKSNWWWCDAWVYHHNSKLAKKQRAGEKRKKISLVHTFLLSLRISFSWFLACVRVGRKTTGKCARAEVFRPWLSPLRGRTRLLCVFEVLAGFSKCQSNQSSEHLAEA